MLPAFEPGQSGSIRIGAVTYLNSRPLIAGLPRLLPNAQIVMDYPSRLADGLSGGRFDVALVPSIECFRNPGHVVVSDACVGCDGPVRSVKLYGRTRVERIRSLALDEGSRTSAALARILLKERFGLSPELRRLPIGAALDEIEADAAVIIGDRGMLPIDGPFEFVWDLGAEWQAWTGLPFVFALWIARPEADLDLIERTLGAARDRGVNDLERIAAQAGPDAGLSKSDCLSYFRDNLRFYLGGRERQGLEAFARLAAAHGLAPSGVQIVFHRAAA